MSYDKELLQEACDDRLYDASNEVDILPLRGVDLEYRYGDLNDQTLVEQVKGESLLSNSANSEDMEHSLGSLTGTGWQQIPYTGLSGNHGDSIEITTNADDDNDEIERLVKKEELQKKAMETERFLNDLKNNKKLKNHTSIPKGSLENKTLLCRGAASTVALEKNMMLSAEDKHKTHPKKKKWKVVTSDVNLDIENEASSSNEFDTDQNSGWHISPVNAWSSSSWESNVTDVVNHSDKVKKKQFTEKASAPLVDTVESDSDSKVKAITHYKPLKPFETGDSDHPSNWKTDGWSSEEGYYLVTLETSSYEYCSIRTEFTNTNVQINRIERLENLDLWGKFQFERERMSKNRPIEFNLNECYLYHGSMVDIAEICSDGLDLRRGKIGFFGRGIYFSDNVNKCMLYSVNPDGSCPSKFPYILKCRVLLGDTKEYAPGEKNPDLKTEPIRENRLPGQPKYYDSVKGNIMGDDEYILYNNNRVMPEYIITYKPTTRKNNTNQSASVETTSKLNSTTSENIATNSVSVSTIVDASAKKEVSITTIQDEVAEEVSNELWMFNQDDAISAEVEASLYPVQNEDLSAELSYNASSTEGAGGPPGASSRAQNESAVGNSKRLVWDVQTADEHDRKLEEVRKQLRSKNKGGSLSSNVQRQTSASALPLSHDEKLEEVRKTLKKKKKKKATKDEASESLFPNETPKREAYRRKCVQASDHQVDEIRKYLKSHHLRLQQQGADDQALNKVENLLIAYSETYGSIDDPASAPVPAVLTPDTPPKPIGRKHGKKKPEEEEEEDEEEEEEEDEIQVAETIDDTSENLQLFTADDDNVIDKSEYATQSTTNALTGIRSFHSVVEDDPVKQVMDSLVAQFKECTGEDDDDVAKEYIKNAQMDINEAVLKYITQ
ncbi:uncharacterized protein LOC102802910 [Saccoglossus kowalevskii]|uniref:Poly [ADP-ribose] polymerase n=1 Tax=Saccoglossus kowalevskii TaxID=10224 RepID=A0ABM0LTT2_SACKO|nr:PREDICTED: uncharacterized protein LOC102802910 [Saccoglossus kowalevskii]